MPLQPCAILACGFQAWYQVHTRLACTALQHPVSVLKGHSPKGPQSQQEGRECEEVEKPSGLQSFLVTSGNAGKSSSVGTMAQQGTEAKKVLVGTEA